MTIWTEIQITVTPS